MCLYLVCTQLGLQYSFEVTLMSRVGFRKGVCIVQTKGLFIAEEQAEDSLLKLWEKGKSFTGFKLYPLVGRSLRQYLVSKFS